MKESEISVRPLRKIAAGKWRSRDGRFDFINGRIYDDQGSNGLYWHVFENVFGVARADEALPERYETLGDAVADIEATEYPARRRA